MEFVIMVDFYIDYNFFLNLKKNRINGVVFWYGFLQFQLVEIKWWL